MSKKQNKRKESNINIGAKYYKYIKNGDDVKLRILRLYKIKNIDTFIMVDDDFNKYTLNKEEFNTWIKLLPNGYINCSLVSMYNTEDVIVSLLRTEEVLETGSGTPFAVCRQQIGDLFANALYHSDMKVGLSINRNNCPVGIDITDVAVCTNIISSNVVSVYLDDKLETILKFIPKAKYDSALYRLNETNKNLNGAVTSLKDLLVSNDFYFDFLEAFNIIKVDCKLDEDLNVVGTNNLLNIQNQLNIKMINPVILKYADDIDLDKINRDYKLLSDIDGDIYIVCYINGGLIKDINSLKQ